MPKIPERVGKVKFKIMEIENTDAEYDQLIFRKQAVTTFTHDCYTRVRLGKLFSFKELKEEAEKVSCSTVDLLMPNMQIAIESVCIPELLGEENVDWQWITRMDAVANHMAVNSIIFDKGDVESPEEQEGSVSKEKYEYIELRCIENEKRDLINGLLSLHLLQSSELENGGETAMQRFNIFRQVSHPEADSGDIVLQFLGVAEIDIMESLLRQKLTYKVIHDVNNY